MQGLGRRVEGFQGVEFRQFEGLGFGRVALSKISKTLCNLLVKTLHP